MPCGCQNKTGARAQFQVVTDNGAGRAVYTSPSADTAKSVAARYPGSVVKNSQSGEIVHRNPAPAANTTKAPPTAQ